MKKMIVITILICLACSSSKKHNFDSQLIISCDIQRIDSVGNVYLVYAKNGGSLFKIMSRKRSHSSNCTRIKVGRSYTLGLQSAFINRQQLPLDLDGIKYYGQTIKLERDSINDLYTSTNLKGLCVIK